MDPDILLLSKLGFNWLEYLRDIALITPQDNNAMTRCMYTILIHSDTCESAIVLRIPRIDYAVMSSANATPLNNSWIPFSVYTVLMINSCTLFWMQSALRSDFLYVRVRTMCNGNWMTSLNSLSVWTVDA